MGNNSSKKEENSEESESRIVEKAGDRVLRQDGDDDNILNDRPVDAENAVPPDAWENQQKAYKDAWNNNKNQALEDDM